MINVISATTEESLEFSNEDLEDVILNGDQQSKEIALKFYARNNATFGLQEGFILGQCSRKGGYVYQEGDELL